MNFDFTQEQQDLFRTLRAFTKKEISPFYTRWDRTEKFPWEPWRKMCGLGLAGMRISEDYGGTGSDCVTTGICLEVIGSGDINCAGLIVMSNLVGEMIERTGAPEIKNRWLTAIAKGEKIGGIEVTEPHCGTDAAAMRTRAVKKGDGYILSGEKSAGSLVMAADALIVLAKTDSQAGPGGVSAFLVEMDSPGVTRQPYKDMGSRCLLRGSVFLDEVEVPQINLLGKEGSGFREAMFTFDFSKAGIALMCLGAAQTAIEDTINYLKERSAFNQPIIRFEGVSFPLMEHHAKIQAGRWLAYHALWLRDRGKPHALEAAMAKMWCPSIAVEAIHDCLVFHGHYGYTQEFSIEQQLRDTIAWEMADGTANAQKIIMVRELLGKRYVPYDKR